MKKKKAFHRSESDNMNPESDSAFRIKGRKIKKKRSINKPAPKQEKKQSNKSRRKHIREIRAITEPLCEAEGMELVFVEYQQESKGKVLRLYIDKPGGVRLDDCVYISRQVEDLLDVHLENNGPYNLEVSSPGPNRPLGKASDFERFRGCMAKIQFINPQDDQNLSLSVNGEEEDLSSSASRAQEAAYEPKQKTVKGVLLGISEGIVRLRLNHETRIIPFENIIRARLVPIDG